MVPFYLRVVRAMTTVLLWQSVLIVGSKKKDESKVKENDNKQITFLGHEVDQTLWDTFQKRIDCVAESGDWEPSQLPRFHMNCNSSFAWAGMCANSHASKVNYDWAVDPKVCPDDPVMKGLNLMVVGDSLSTEFCVSLKNRIYEGAPEQCEETCWHICEHQFSMPCKKFAGADYKDFKLYDYRNDKLSLTEVKVHNYTINVLENVWFKVVGEQKIDVLLLNRGAHYAPLDIVLAELTQTLSALKRAYPKLTIIWRNTPRGHTAAEITNFMGAPLPRNYTAPTDLPYHWGDILLQNAHIRELLAKNFPGVLYLDIATATGLRSDSHMEGYHYCIPGPVDSLVNLFLYSMKVAESLFVK